MRRLEELILPKLEKKGENNSYWWANQWYTASNLLKMVEDNKKILIDSGFQPGQRLVTLLPNCPAFLAISLAAWSLKGTIVPLNITSGSDVLIPTLKLIDPFAIIIPEGDNKFAADVTDHVIAQTSLNGSLHPFKGHIGETTSEDYSVFFTTSGTTGMPKAVPLTHENIHDNLTCIPPHINLTDKDSYLWVLPNFHSFGFTVGAFMGLALGGNLVIVPLFMPPAETLRAIINAKPTILILVPTMVEFLRRASLQTEARPDSVRMVITGGDRLNTELDKASQELFGVGILEGYGTTECSPVVAVNPSYEKRKLGTIGSLLGSFQWAVRDSNGNDLPPEQPGLFWVKGPSVFHGYYKSPEVTAERLTENGWYNTGDVVKHDSDGYITVLDRATDIIIVGGFNVYPQEVERVLNSHPSVSLSAIVAMSHIVNGQIPKAFVILKEGHTLTERELISFCKGKLASYKVPRKVEFVETLPISAAGKVLRRKLRELE